jgi:hypothetical protein
MSKISDSTGSQIGESWRNGVQDVKLVWEGVTLDATATEIYLRSKDNPATGGRLILPASGLFLGEGLFAAFNDTDTTVLCSGRFAVSVTNLAGTVAASGTTLEWDAAATDANPYIQYFVGSTGLALAYNNTSKSLTVTVTGTASKRIRWIVEIRDLIGM